MSEHAGLRTLLVSQAAAAADTVLALSEAGFEVVGPAPDAAMALTLAAQSHADVALIHVEVAGPREGHSLAKALLHDWGVPSVLFDARPDRGEELARIVRALREAARSEAG
jgi:DNA-binding NarL/FixJ family response regulator